jgi:hypothetical protein
VTSFRGYRYQVDLAHALDRPDCSSGQAKPMPIRSAHNRPIRPAWPPEAHWERRTLTRPRAHSLTAQEPGRAGWRPGSCPHGRARAPGCSNLAKHAGVRGGCVGESCVRRPGLLGHRSAVSSARSSLSQGSGFSLLHSSPYGQCETESDKGLRRYRRRNPTIRCGAEGPAWQQTQGRARPQHRCT